MKLSFFAVVLVASAIMTISYMIGVFVGKRVGLRYVGSITIVKDGEDRPAMFLTSDLEIEDIERINAGVVRIRKLNPKSSQKSNRV